MLKFSSSEELIVAVTSIGERGWSEWVEQIKRGKVKVAKRGTRWSLDHVTPCSCFVIQITVGLIRVTQSETQEWRERFSLVPCLPKGRFLYAEAVMGSIGRFLFTSSDVWGLELNESHNMNCSGTCGPELHSGLHTYGHTQDAADWLGVHCSCLIVFSWSNVTPIRPSH